MFRWMYLPTITSIFLIEPPAVPTSEAGPAYQDLKGRQQRPMKTHIITVATGQSGSKTPSAWGQGGGKLLVFPLPEPLSLTTLLIIKLRRKGLRTVSLIRPGKLILLRSLISKPTLYCAFIYWEFLCNRHKMIYFKSLLVLQFNIILYYCVKVCLFFHIQSNLAVKPF